MRTAILALLLAVAPVPTPSPGRVVIVFVDDLHVSFRQTGHLREFLKRVAGEIDRDGDLYGMFTTGPSAIALEPGADRAGIADAIKRVSGAALRPGEVAGAPYLREGALESRYRVHVALTKAYEILHTLERIDGRRRTVIWVSAGYDFDPAFPSRQTGAVRRFSLASWWEPRDVPAVNPFSKTGLQLTAEDLAAELAELIRASRRAATAIYTIDPQQIASFVRESPPPSVDPADWQTHLRETHISLRLIAESTGGLAVFEESDLRTAFERIEAN